MYIFIDVTEFVHYGISGPDRVITLGYVRPVTCDYEGDFVGGAGYECVMRNFHSMPSEVDMECASYDNQGRMIGSPDGVPGLGDVVFNVGEERIARLYFNPKASLSICAYMRNSIPPYNDALKMLSDPTAQKLVSELTL
ncbi:MAG: hypothetical protein MN733_13290 [Nitrososphaera sp.]|nr:hypothetical protein [Nitrososphaera sp.]